MRGIICRATLLQRGSRLRAAQVTHFLIFHSASAGRQTAAGAGVILAAPRCALVPTRSPDSALR